MGPWCLCTGYVILIRLFYPYKVILSFSDYSRLLFHSLVFLPEQNKYQISNIQGILNSIIHQRLSILQLCRTLIGLNLIYWKMWLFSKCTKPCLSSRVPTCQLHWTLCCLGRTNFSWVSFMQILVIILSYKYWILLNFGRWFRRCAFIHTSVCDLCICVWHDILPHSHKRGKKLHVKLVEVRWSQFHGVNFHRLIWDIFKGGIVRNMWEFCF